MPSPSTLAYWEGLIIIAGFFGVVFWKMVTDGMSLNQLFEGDSDDSESTYVSAGRVQSFVVTVSVAFYYLMQVVHNPRQFPELPTSMVAVVAGSQAIYLGGKAHAMLAGRLRDFFK